MVQSDHSATRDYGTGEFPLAVGDGLLTIVVGELRERSTEGGSDTAKALSMASSTRTASVAKINIRYRTLIGRALVLEVFPRPLDSESFYVPTRGAVAPCILLYIEVIGPMPSGEAEYVL